MVSAIVTTPTPKLEASVDFYTRLGFERLPGEARAYFDDGGVVVEIDPDRYARTGIRLFADDWTKQAESLDGVVERDGVFVATAPSGVRVYLDQARPAALAERKPRDSFTRLGKFAGLSVETADLARERLFWEQLGYAVVPEKSGESWLTMDDGRGLGLSIMPMFTCPHLFFSPGLTYFNSGKNLDNLAKIREARVPLLEEITCFNEEGVVDNAIVQDPGGTGFFVFND